MSHDNKTTWSAICSLDDIVPNTGVCALVRDRHVAVFHIDSNEPQLYAIDNFDPNAQASVLSRGLIGNIGERVVVASPIYKHHFDLQNGECLEAPEKSVKAYPVRVENRTVWVGV
ncbi:assimilatory nitrite reductase (NAD(P)H) small subunit [Noviherbaspirillum humi]|uniref:Assimilatory nitrite reductase (NAD(P)H) small subunit n=1 Tax=Noviherbaspirillum humi TaxID=1688639 RepID=A0A239L401_9BURK|nr:nitrite reductase small subunit NirD [Noviherbaspirillum humi]SNT24722.1 assimilatory nitrite reductase (NAD(P)H) small subunit [Noviherbaspirillum humi]